MKNIKKRIVSFFEKMTSTTEVFWFLACVAGAYLLIFDVFYFISSGDRWDYIINIIVEGHGLLFDLLILGVLFSIYESRRQKKENIKRDEDLIDDFRGWDEKEAMFRIVGAVRRLNKLEAKNIGLEGCFLKEAALSHANLQKANLFDANLQKANLFDANLQGAKLWKTNLQEAKLSKANLYGADLLHADLQRAVLLEADLQRANLLDAKLDGATMIKVNLRNANLLRANLQGANLYEVDLQGAFVDNHWFEKLDQWQVNGRDEIKQKYHINEKGYLIENALPAEQ